MRLAALLQRARILCGLLLLTSAPLVHAQAAAASTGKVLRVAAAADLEPVLPEVLQRFAQATGVHAEAAYQSSATLTQQILNGAPFDLFFAADLGFPQRVVDAALATEAKPVAYARGTLVLWARRDAPVLGGKPLTLAVLRDPALKSVAIANPDHAPYGRAAQAAVASMQLSAQLGPKLRVASNIAEAAQFTDSGNAEVGFLSLTGAGTPKLRADGTYVAVPESAYPAIVQGAVVLKHAADPADAERLLQFVATPAIRELLAQRGLLQPR